MSVALALVVVAAGIAVGVLSALFGVGGGILMVPFMAIVLNMTQHAAEGTSLAVIVPTAIAGVIAHHRRNYVSFRHAALLGLGGIVGAVAGAWFAQSLDADLLQKLFGAFVFVMGGRLILGGLRSPQP